MTKQRFSEQEIIGENHRIEFYFEKDERQFRLVISRKGDCEYFEVDEQNDSECTFHACKVVNVEEYIKLQKPLSDVLIELHKLTNNLMNSLE